MTLQTLNEDTAVRAYLSCEEYREVGDMGLYTNSTVTNVTDTAGLQNNLVVDGDGDDGDCI